MMRRLKKPRRQRLLRSAIKPQNLNTALLDRYKVLNPKATELPQGYALDANSTSKDFDRVDKIMQQTEAAEATKANRDIVNGMREQMLDLAKGVKIPGDETKTGPEYLATLPVGWTGKHPNQSAKGAPRPRPRARAALRLNQSWVHSIVRIQNMILRSTPRISLLARSLSRATSGRASTPSILSNITCLVCTITRTPLSLPAA